MKGSLLIKLYGYLIACLVAVLPNLPAMGQSPQDVNDPTALTLTNALQIHQLGSASDNSRYAIRLEGAVLWVSPDRDEFILWDDTGGVMIKMELPQLSPIQPGQRVLVEGSCLIKGGELASVPLINNDGIHSATEKTEKVLLTAGRHPIIVEWFNGPADFALEMNWAGPKIARQRIPDTALFRKEMNSNETNRLLPGLVYQDYEGDWNGLPIFSDLPILKQGTVDNFDLSVRSRDTNVALVFSGYLDVPRTGSYQFWLKSDDGSKLYMDLLQVTVLGKADWPLPQGISAESMSKDTDYHWTEAEGIVTRINQVYDGVLVELTSGAGRTYLKVINGDYDSFWSLLHSRIKTFGISQNAYTVDSQTVPFLLIPDYKEVDIAEIMPTHWGDCPLQSIYSVIENGPPHNGTIVHISGIIASNGFSSFPLVEDGSGQILLETLQPSPSAGEKIEAVGWLSLENGRETLRGVYREMATSAEDNTNNLPVLTKAIQVKSLSRQEAQRGYPVKIEGVVTARLNTGFAIQDATWSVFCYWSIPDYARLPQVGEYWKIEGVSDVQFAPDVLVQRASYLRPGILPEPIRPTRDELINGSLDTQYIEIQGIVTAIDTGTMTLLAREGKIKILFFGLAPKFSDGIEGALVRIRGVASPDRDTNQMIMPTQSPLRLFNAAINVDEPAVSRPFEIPLKRVTDLLLFNPHADALRPVRIAGQVLTEYQGEYFLLDSDNGLRFDPKGSVNLHPGDSVEVVGFPDMTGSSPVLREALVRSVGKAALPAAHHLLDEDILNRKHDATLVSIQARLTDISTEGSDQVLELQTKTQNFVARLVNSHGVIQPIQPGSLLELTGVYIGIGGDWLSARDITGFELLLNSPSSVQVLARPPWWTLRHMFTVLAVMLLIILGALTWIALLRRQVEERTLQLTEEIRNREVAERQRLLETERARIAQDLHDELGATLTEIRFLGAVKSRDALVSGPVRSQLEEISEKSRQMVSSLDEIVWAVNPANDTLPSLANYLRHVAGEFFRSTEIRCRQDVDEKLPALSLTSEMRHNLYLVVREALNNIAKHSQASEAWLRIHWQDGVLCISIEDNGRGFMASNTSGNGLLNMRCRLEKVGGSFTCDTRPGFGAVYRIHVPLK